jgi:hypothetical protein
MKLPETAASSNKNQTKGASMSIGFDDEESTRKGVSIEPKDVLCGRGKTSFNHCKYCKARLIKIEIMGSFTYPPDKIFRIVFSFHSREPAFPPDY